MGSRRTYSGDLRDILNAGLLQPGEELTCEPRKGELYRATLQADGKIRYNGTEFNAPTDWASNVAGNSRNGWRDIHARGKSLAEFRDQLLSVALKPPVKPARAEAEIGPQLPAEALADQDAQQQLKNKLLKLELAIFEKLMGKLLASMGMSDVHITVRTHDGGIDGEAEMPVMGIKIAFQAKRWQPANPVGADPVRNLMGSVVGNKYDRGIFITTSRFTAGAREEAEKPDSKVVLIDGDRLVNLMREKGLGITKVPVVREELDEEFFRNLNR